MSSTPSNLRGIPDVAALLEAPGGLTRLKITTALADAELSLDGAHVIHFQPRGSAPVLFLSGSSHLAPGQPIRGGVPVCFPWFGPRAGYPDSPAHGFARISRWELESLEGSADQGVKVGLKMTSNDATLAAWPYEFVARLTVEVTRTLRVALEVENRGLAPFEFEEALHTYFAVSDVREVAIAGLEDAFYFDKTDGMQRKQLDRTPLRITRETGRSFSRSRGDLRHRRSGKSTPHRCRKIRFAVDGRLESVDRESRGDV